jgi:hypothetical protein
VPTKERLLSVYYLCAIKSTNTGNLMSNKPAAQSSFDQPNIYQIRVKGTLHQQWSDWFGGLTISPAEDGTTLLTGPVVDDAALHGLLKKVRDSGVPLLSVNRIENAQADAVDIEPAGDSLSVKSVDQSAE